MQNTAMRLISLFVFFCASLLFLNSCKLNDNSISGSVASFCSKNVAQLDTNFGTNGSFTIDINSVDNGTVYGNGAFDILPSGEIILAGTGNNGTYSTNAVIKLSKDGVLDTSFGTAGIVTIDLGATSPVRSLVADAGGIYIGNKLTGFRGISKLNLDGSIDTTFGTAGRVADTHTGEADAFTKRSDGSLFISGHASGPHGVWHDPY